MSCESKPNTSSVLSEKEQRSLLDLHDGTDNGMGNEDDFEDLRISTHSKFVKFDIDGKLFVFLSSCLLH